MKTTLIGLIVLTLSFTVVACGDDNNNNNPGTKVDSKTAAVVQQETKDAVTSVVRTQLLDDSAIDALGDAGVATGGWFSGSMSQFDVSGNMVNDLGGALAVSGTGAEQSLPGAFDFDLGLAFNDWTASGLLLNGDLQIKVAITSYTPPEVSVEISGTLQVSGDFEGSVPIDLSLDISGDTESVCGAVAGYGDLCDGTNTDGDDPITTGSEVDTQEASLIQSAIALAMARLQGDLVTDLSLLASGAPLAIGLLSGSAASFDVGGSISSPVVGAMALDGTGGTDTLGYAIDLDADLTGWKDATGVVLDGVLTVTYEISEVVPLEATVVVSGTVDASGAAEGQGVVDLNMSVTDEDTVICGTVANYDISDPDCL